MARRVIKKGNVTRHFDEAYGGVYWTNDLVEGFYPNKATAQIAYRLDNAMADTAHWLECWREVMDVYEDVYKCPYCRRALTGLHETSCNGFQKIVQKKAMTLWEKNYAGDDAYEN